MADFVTGRLDKAMKTFFEMLEILEADLGPEQQGPELGLGNEQGQASPDQGGDQPEQDASPEDKGAGMETKHYMFFSNLKVIKDMVDEMLAMDPAKVDQMLDDGHDWASDHISTSRDDVEEVHNWLSSSIEGRDSGDQGSEEPSASSQE